MLTMRPDVVGHRRHAVPRRLEDRQAEALPLAGAGVDVERAVKRRHLLRRRVEQSMRAVALDPPAVVLAADTAQQQLDACLALADLAPDLEQLSDTLIARMVFVQAPAVA